MNSNKTLQSQINNASGKQNRQELLNKLHENINKKREERLTVSPHVMNKLNKEVAEEKKQNDSDPRVTPIMKDYFIKALKMYLALVSLKEVSGDFSKSAAVAFCIAFHANSGAWYL